MELRAGMIVRNRAGHNIGDFFVILSIDKNSAYIVDGKHRKLENPKKKNIKHLHFTRKSIELDGITNKKIRAALTKLNEESANNRPEGE